ncbi:hypothetical protein G9447_13970 [Actinopolyspora sp. BKK1]|uniref:Uncharacterized protein n=1 Tax=Actinopolyspora saharensis TaxID=995062 RepID=A0A1H1FLI4_9ACTN|nr:hypothetical protein [Actinopolyspora sp. BKK2]NHE77308.1 hypothetical protein [Actinopolyspora sp. BKK1]SDR01775.1 hypothetical protein SAMN04489718_3106 [Actinopolyspora saharensis]
MASFEHSGSADSADSAPRSESRRNDSGEIVGRNHGQVRCLDVNHTPRALEVLVNRDRVVLAGPPGATAALSAERVGQLSSALRFAADQARK